MLRRKWVWGIGFLCIAVAAALHGLSDFDLNRHHQTQLSFEVAGQVMSGTLVQPGAEHTGPIALFVHGDGPQDRFSGQGYLPMINAFVDADIGVFTWDKPGIGRSDGNWLDQSMQDRAAEVVAAYRMIQAQPDVLRDTVGVVGFSQAGWVIPKVAKDVDPAFTVLIGVAVDWQQQGDYYTMMRLRGEGLDEAAIAAQITADQAADDVFFARGQVPDADSLGGLARDRFKFIQRNRMADATAEIAFLSGPVLALWGADDLNVDPVQNAAVYRDLLPDRVMQRVMVMPDATHGLLRRWPFNSQLTTQWSRGTTFAFALAGRKAYAPGALDDITSWIISTTK